jgi:hypothetical protein
MKVETVERTSIPKGSKELSWTYENPDHNASPRESFSFAKIIYTEFKSLRLKGIEENDAKNILLENPSIRHFASDRCFPRLFQICTSDSTTDNDFDLIQKLVAMREKVNNGVISEELGARGALQVAFEATKSREF